MLAMVTLSMWLKPSQADRRQARLFTDEFDMASRFSEDNYELRPINDSYYIRISANNSNWTRYLDQARNAAKRGTANFTMATAVSSTSRYG